MIRSDQLDHHFVQEILAEPGGKNLLACWSCGTCAATCLIRRYDPSFNPRLTLHRAGLGLREQVLSSPEIWQCSACDACYPRCPRQIHISEVMGAIRNIATREGHQPPGPFATVDQEVCSGCAVCTRACPYGAISRVPRRHNGDERMVAEVDHTLCQRCGICVAACPSGAVSLEVFSHRELVSRLGEGGWLNGQGYLEGRSEVPRIAVLVCQWSIHSDTEWAQLRTLESDHLRLVNLPCSGRVNTEMILLALTQGADGVLVVGCKEGECHYQRGTYLGRGKVALLEQVLAQMSISRVRVGFAELGALDRRVLPELVQRMSDEIVASVTATA